MTAGRSTCQHQPPAWVGSKLPSAWVGRELHGPAIYVLPNHILHRLRGARARTALLPLAPFREALGRSPPRRAATGHGAHRPARSSPPRPSARQDSPMAWGGLFLSLSRPSPEQQKSCLAAAGSFNYDTALHGASSTPRSPTALTSEASDRALVDRGFSVNRSRVLIGSGADTFLHAKSALLSWKHLALGWANVEPETPVKAGTRFCICYKEVIPWVMFPLQIAYVTDGNGSSVGRAKGGVFAFGSGTLQGHLLAGEERFSVQLDDDERVWYEVFSFSKPAHILSALCYPYVQLRQRHFARESGKALLKHVAGCSRSQ